MAGPARVSEDDESRQLLRAFVAGRDVACPNCQYNLRGCVSASCPECGEALRLSVGLAEPRLGLWVAGLVGIACGLGLFGYIAIFNLVQTLFSSWGRSVMFIIVVGLPALLHALSLWFWLRRRRWIRGRSLGVRRWLVVLAWLHPVAWIVLWLVIF